MTPYGRTLVSLRIHRGLTQRGLAAAANISPKMLSDVETGRRRALDGADRERVRDVLQLSDEELAELDRQADMSSFHLTIPRDASPAVMEAAHELARVMYRMDYDDARAMKRLADEVAQRATPATRQSKEADR